MHKTPLPRAPSIVSTESSPSESSRAAGKEPGFVAPPPPPVSSQLSHARPGGFELSGFLCQELEPRYLTLTPPAQRMRLLTPSVPSRVGTRAASKIFPSPPSGQLSGASSESSVPSPQSPRLRGKLSAPRIAVRRGFGICRIEFSPAPPRNVGGSRAGNGVRLAREQRRGGGKRP